MTDYTKLVEALRCREYKPECGSSDCPYWSGLGCMDGQLMEDAADAIEALQADQKKTVTQIFGEEQMAWEERCKDLMYWIADLQAQLPKRGEWIEENRRPRSSQFVCSECHRTAYDPQPTRDKAYRKRCRYAYCPNCGAKMTEVQDG